MPEFLTETVKYTVSKENSIYIRIRDGGKVERPR